MLVPRNNALSADIRAQLAAGLDRVDLQAGPRLVRIELETSLQPWDWLRCQQDTQRLYWRSRSGDLEVSGVGVAHAVESGPGLGLAQPLDRLRQLLDNGERDINYYGGMAFDQAGPLIGPWQALPPVRFVVPRLELRHQQGNATCALNLKLPDDRAHLSDLLTWAEESFSPSDQGLEAFCPGVSLGPAMTRQITPDRQQWSGQVRSLLQALHKTEAKLVLACHERICFEQAVDAMEVLRRIRSDRRDSYGFLLTFGQTAFMGMSPEQLYERQGQFLFSEALAGTGRTDADLQASAKENAEHDYVVRDVKEALGTIGMALDDVPPKEIVHWNRLCHLRTPIKGRLPEDVDDGDILRALHPSAAVLGYPRERAWSWLGQYESLQRGWYAGPVGRIGRDTAEFAVAIRSALVQGKTLDIYAGAGIVRGSDPDLEWEEIRSKMRQFHEALGLRS